MFKADYHIVPMEGGFVLEREGARRPVSTHSLLEEAIRAGRILAQRDRSRLVVHRTDGFAGDLNEPWGSLDQVF
jgi:hypothetical protein